MIFRREEDVLEEEFEAAAYNNEDIPFCVDVDSESLFEMKNTGPSPLFPNLLLRYSFFGIVI